MEKLPDTIPTMKIVWSKHRVTPPTSVSVITITLDTSVEVGSIKEWLLSTLTETLQSIAIQTGAEEKLISIETQKLEQ